MNCEIYQEQISQYIDGELTLDLEKELFRHLCICDKCRAFLKDNLSLRNAFAAARPVPVAASLDQRVLDLQSPVIRHSALHNFVRLMRNNHYSFRTVGYTVLFSIITGVFVSSLWFHHNKPQPTIVCLAPLPEVEVTGYIVVASSNEKGIKQ